MAGTGKKLFKFAVVVALAGAAVWWVWLRPPKDVKPPAPPPVQVSAATVEKRDMPQEVRLVGTVYAYETVAVKSRIDSQIMAVRFHDGDLVRQGEVLFELDARTIDAQRAALAANLKRDEVQLRNAKSQYERSAQLMKQGYVTKEKIDQDKTAFEAQSANLTATKAQIDNLDVQRDYAVIKAPITGRAGTIAVTLGNNVRANDAQPLVTINKIDPVRVQFSVPQRYFDRLKTAMTAGKVAVTATRSETQSSLPGTVEYIDNAIDQSNGTFAARAIFGNAEEKLWPGMFVDVTLTLETVKDALVIPMAAVQGPSDGQFVFVVDPATHKAAKRPVKASPQADNSAIAQSGLAEGETVITDGLLRVSDGAAVDVAGTKNDASSEKPAP